MTQYNRRKKEIQSYKEIKELEQRLEKKDNLILKLEVEISKLKVSSLKLCPKLVIQQVQTTSIPPKPMYHPAIIRACLSMFGKKPDALDPEETAKFVNYQTWKLQKGEPIEQEMLYNPAGGNQPCLHCNLPT